VKINYKDSFWYILLSFDMLKLTPDRGRSPVPSTKLGVSVSRCL